MKTFYIDLYDEEDCQLDGIAVDKENDKFFVSDLPDWILNPGDKIIIRDSID